MPHHGKRWRHVILTTYASWLPGEQRGFRSKRRKVHSGGDYKNRPPPSEHAGLWRYAQRISGERIIIPDTSREVVAHRLVEVLQKLGHRVLIVAMAGTHAHLLVELNRKSGVEGKSGSVRVDLGGRRIVKKKKTKKHKK